VSSAAVLEDTVVVGGGDGLVHAFNATTGRPKWTFHTNGRVRSSPAITDGAVFVGSYDGSLYAIAIKSGNQLWRFDTKGRSLNSADFGFDRKSILSSPAVSDGVVYIGSRDAHLYAVDAATGALRWAYDYENDDMTWAISSPAVRDQSVYMGTADGSFVHALRVTDGRELWRFKMPGRVWSSPAVAGSELYVTNQCGALYAVNLASGQESWHFQTESSVQSSPAVANGVVYFGSNDGAVYAIRTDGPQPMRRAVYWDADATKLFARSDLGPDYKEFALVRDFLHARGYEVLDPSTLGDWLSKRMTEGAPSVIVFPSDVLPASLTRADPARSPLRLYLESGGKVVWIGFPPMLLKLTVEQGAMTDARIRWEDASNLLGVSFQGALNNEMDNNQVTPTGRDWGLAEWWLGSWDLPISSNTIALALDNRGFAGSWVKSYGGAPGTGFVYVGTKSFEGAMLSRLAIVAEYRPKRQ
jgi:outer membrane protein assembly factor BamB